MHRGFWFHDLDRRALIVLPVGALRLVHLAHPAAANQAYEAPGTEPCAARERGERLGRDDADRPRQEFSSAIGGSEHGLDLSANVRIVSGLVEAALPLFRG